MSESLETLVHTLMRIMFGGVAETTLHVNEPADLVLGTATFTWSQRDLAHALTRGTGAFVDAFKERIGGTSHKWVRRVEGWAEEKARPFSWKAARRCGRHKRPAK